MFTDRLHWDRSGDDQLVISGVVGERGQVERAGTEHLGVGTRHPGRCRGQTLCVEVDTKRHQERGCSLLCGDQINSTPRLDYPQRGPVVTASRRCHRERV